MCTLALYFRVLDEFPLVVAANRDEKYDRPSALPSLVGTKPRIFAGKDLRAGGTWLGVNESGLLAGILNRKASAGNDPRNNFRSRGLLCLDLLGCRTVGQACGVLASQGKAAYQPFTLVLADENEAWVAHNGASRIALTRLGAGLHVFSNTYEFDERSEKIHRAYGRFAQLIDALRRCSDQGPHGVSALAEVLGDHTLGDGGNEPKEAICVHGDGSGTVSSSVVFYSRHGREFQNFFSAGAPCQTPFLRYPSLPVR